MPPNTIKLGKNSKTNLDQFLTLDLDQLLTLETPNLGPVFNSTAYIYNIRKRESAREAGRKCEKREREREREREKKR